MATGEAGLRLQGSWMWPKGPPQLSGLGRSDHREAFAASQLPPLLTGHTLWPSGSSSMIWVLPPGDQEEHTSNLPRSPQPEAGRWALRRSSRPQQEGGAAALGVSCAESQRPTV